MFQPSHRIPLATIERRRTARACRPAIEGPSRAKLDRATIHRFIVATSTGLALSTLVTANDAVATPVTALSYSMPNGDGKAIGGGNNYWDGTYNGTGNKTEDGSALSGGLGALTDGVIATQTWSHVSNLAGTGQDVGWFYTETPNPTIVFTFAAGSTINDVDIYLDNSGSGGVFAPSTILIDGTSVAFIAPALGTVGEVAIHGLNLTGTSHTIQLDQASPADWVMVSEIAFAKNVPEPGVMALLGLGIAVATCARSRRKSSRQASAAIGTRRFEVSRSGSLRDSTSCMKPRQSP